MHNVNTPNRNSYSKQPTDLSLFTKAPASDWYRSNQNKISNLRNVFFWCWAVVVIDGVLFSSANRRVIWFQATFSNRIQENYLLNRFKARFAFSMSFFFCSTVWKFNNKKYSQNEVVRERRGEFRCFAMDRWEHTRWKGVPRVGFMNTRLLFTKYFIIWGVYLTEPYQCIRHSIARCGGLGNN